MTQEIVFDEKRNALRRRTAGRVAFVAAVLLAVCVAGPFAGFAGNPMFWALLAGICAMVVLLALIVARNAPAYEIRPDLTGVHRAVRP